MSLQDFPVFKLFKTSAPKRDGVRTPSAVRSSSSLPPERTSAQWQMQRGPERASDRCLSELAVRWRASLPSAERPVHLCERYPRIANRLALVWPDAVLADRCLEELVVDRRGGRRGFAPEIMAELIQLRALRKEPAPARHSGSLQMKVVDFDVR